MIVMDVQPRMKSLVDDMDEQPRARSLVDDTATSYDSGTINAYCARRAPTAPPGRPRGGSEPPQRWDGFW